MLKVPLMKNWRWWGLAAAVALMVRRIRRAPSSLTRVRAPDEKTPPAAVPGQTPGADELRDIFSFGRRLVATQAVHTDAGRVACLFRAAETVLKNRNAAAALVATQGEAFVGLCKEPQARAESDCERCGARMHEASSHDETLDEWMPVWQCARCGAQVPR